MKLKKLARYLALGSVGDVVQQARPPQQSDFGGGGLRSPIYINFLTGEAFIYVNGVITPFNSIAAGGFATNVAAFPYYAGRGGDDTAAIQAALNATPKPFLFFPKGTYIVSSQLNAPAGTRLFGQEMEGTIIQRTATHTGHTLVVGTEAAHAGSIDISGLTFRRPITFNGGSPYIAGTSTLVDNKLTGGQAHLQVRSSQGALINSCTFRDMPIGIDLRGCTLTTIRDCIVSGSIWDQLTVGLQEGLDAILLTQDDVGNACTVITIDNCHIGGGYGSAVRPVTIGSIVANYSENVGQQFGIRVNGVEGLTVKGTYVGGQNTYGIFIESRSGVTSSNIKIVGGNFFDGSRLRCIHFDQANIGGSTVLVNITANNFNGEFACQSHIYANDTFGVPCLFQATIGDNTMMGSNLAAMVFRGALGVKISDNVVSSYNARGGNTGDPAGSAGCFVVLGAANCDKVFTSGNIWGGGANNLSSTNNCQWGVFFNGAAVTAAGASGERSAGLGLGAGALVNVAQTYPV